jgi:hypothetical protein
LQENGWNWRSPILSKISQTQKDKYPIFLSYAESRSIHANKQKDVNLNGALFGEDQREGERETMEGNCGVVVGGQ